MPKDFCLERVIFSIQILLTLSILDPSEKEGQKASQELLNVIILIQNIHHIYQNKIRHFHTRSYLCTLTRKKQRKKQEDVA